MRKINGVPFTAHIDLSSLTGGEVIKWDSTNTLMAWEDQDSTGFVPLPAWVGGRGVFGGGEASGKSNIIDYITIATTGNATDFGDITVARDQGASFSDGTYGVYGGGEVAAPSNIIEYVTIATLGNGTDFGDLSSGRNGAAGLSGD